jgi:hypothetical protein
MKDQPFFVDSQQIGYLPRESIYATDWSASWWRHAPCCQPGLYYVTLSCLTHRIESFFGLTDMPLHRAAVMDDFGNLVPVETAQ